MTEHDIHCFRVFMRAAVPAVAEMPPEERADAYDGMGIACDEIDQNAADAARAAAAAIRDAETKQLVFRQILS